MEKLKFMCSGFSRIFVLLNVLSFYNQNNMISAIPVDSGSYQLNRIARHLIIKPFPAIENYQSDLYEVFMEPYEYNLKPVAAVASFSNRCDNPIKGDITFIQMQSPAGAVFIRGNVTGLSPGKHGIHIHESGDTRMGCENLGGHFNPYYLPHGGPTSPIRHLGDLGNIRGEDDETAKFDLIDPLMSLVGPRSVVGRTLVITSEEDDLGLYGTPESMTTGSTGKPLACAIISYMN
nr:putative extracellular copper/zinc superoxide dismutase [Holotrichia parallela]